MKMELLEAKRILSLVAADPDHGARGAWEDQDVAARIILKELARLERENRKLRGELERVNKEVLR